MKPFLRTLSLVSGTALLFAAVPFADADPLTITSFTVYENFAGYNAFQNGGSDASAVPTTSNPSSTNLAYGVFDATTLAAINAAGSLNYVCGGGGPHVSPDPSCYYADAFYNNPTYSSTGNGVKTNWDPNADMAYTGAYITGTLYLPAGTDTLTTMSDDGLILTINGTQVIDSPGEQFDTPANSGMYTAATSGLYNFTIQYAQNDLNPADLIFSDPYTSDGGPRPPSGSTPEPSSLLLLGTGVLGAAGLLRRRMAVAPKSSFEGIQ